MPNITEFDAGPLAIHPSETGVESFAAAGRRAGAFYNQAGETLSRVGSEFGRAVATAGDVAVNYMDHQQINAGADHGATLFANLTDSWNKTAANADVHDPAVAQKWREEQLEPALQQFSQGFSTEKSQDWANRFVNTQRQHFFTKTEADMSSMASAAVHESVTNAVTKYSNVAVTDPSSVDTSVKLFKQNLDDVIAANPNIKGPDAARVRLEVAEKGVREIVKAGAMGAILNSGDPEAAAAAWAKKYPDYVSGPEELQLAHAARIQAKQNTLLTKQIQTENIRQAEFKMNSTINEASDKYVKIDPTGHVTIDPEFVKTVNDITKTGAPNAWKMKEELGNWIEKQQKDPTGGVTDAATRDELDSRLWSADNPTTVMDLRRAQLPAPGFPNGRLSNRDLSIREAIIKDRDGQLAELLKNPQVKYATDYAKQVIDESVGGAKFAKGQFPAFMLSFLNEYKTQKANGTLKADWLDIKNSESLISKAMAPYVTPVSGAIDANGGIPSVPSYMPPAPPAELSLPPVAKRVKGQAYPTARGMMTWTGTGWLPPAQPVTLQPGQM